MDETQFYTEASEVNGAYFKGLIAECTKKGGTLQWGAGGVGLRSPVGAKPVGICFLAPAFAGKKDRIELSLAILAKQIGAARCDHLTAALRKAAGDHLKWPAPSSLGRLPFAS